MKRIIVVGGGASGLVAAISAARAGADVTILEQKDRIGKKLLSTGNGRCNLTNTHMNVSCFRGDHMEEVAAVLEQFGYSKTQEFFEELGVILKDRQGYIYPISDQAATVLDVLRMEIEQLMISVCSDEKVLRITKNGKGFCVQTNNKIYKSDAVILSTGGKAASVLGSDGSGYSLAKDFGHCLSPVVPALVQLRAKGNFFKHLSGVRTQAKVSLFVEQKFVCSDEGELQLTNYGISGIPVFQVSRFAAKALYEKKSVYAELDLMPSMSEEAFYDFLLKRKKRHSSKSAEQFLIGMFNKKLIPVLLKEVHSSLDKPINEVDDDHIYKLAMLCKHFKVTIVDTNGFEAAQVCAGGVKTNEINAHTMESIYVEGLYLTGELLDVDGICGGYNLQWAWATGFIAGKNAAKG